ncbi:hypothetical protein MKW92_051454 [Papaver armeniacum]|nr:hypothetical protein MKW92_051454 [Papaver armeniacum]
MRSKGLKVMEWRWGFLYTKPSEIRIGLQRVTMYHGLPLYTPPDTSTSTWKLAKATILRNIEQYPGASKVAF